MCHRGYDHFTAFGSETLAPDFLIAGKVLAVTGPQRCDLGGV
jgi:hypothetical protein